MLGKERVKEKEGEVCVGFLLPALICALKGVGGPC